MRTPSSHNLKSLLAAKAVAARLHASAIQAADGSTQDVVSLDVPALIRCLEIAREELSDDNSLHEFTEQLIAASKTKGSALNAEDIAALPQQVSQPPEKHD